MILVLERMTEPLVGSLVWSDEVTIASLLHRVHIGFDPLLIFLAWRGQQLGN